MIKYVLGFSIFCTFLLINLGGLVHNTGSSLACPDWPLCYGQLMPKMEGGILIEHSHRLLGALVGFLNIVLVGLFWREKNKYPKLFKVSLITLGMVIFQGLLGGLTVIYKLPTIVSTFHLALSMIYFLSLVGMLFYLEPKTTNIKTNSLFTVCSFGVLFLVYGQMILGAFMRHSGLGGVCGVGIENSIACFDMVSMSTPMPSSFQGWIHFSHRLLGAFVGVVIFIFAHYLFHYSKLKMNAVSMIIIIVFQIILGILTVQSNLGVWQTTLHLTGSAILLVLCFISFLQLKSNQNFTEVFSTFKDIISLTKPRLSGLVIITSGLGMAMAPGDMSMPSMIINLISISMIVAGACAINCYMEREGDKLMDRTKVRPLPSGRLDPDFALFFGIALMVIFTPIIALASNILTATLGAIACILYIFLYTPLKRKTTLALFAGAIPGALPPLMGWTSVTNSIDKMGLLLFGVLFVWQLPHFLAISLVYLKEYQKAGIQIIPVTHGVWATKIRIVLYTIILMMISLLPAIWEVKSATYISLVSLCGALFLVYALIGLRTGKEWEISRPWARKYFFGSLIYLPSVLVLMMIF